MKDLGTRNRLLLLLLLAAIPALALTVYISLSQRTQAEAETREDIVNLARMGAQQQAQIVDGARQLLVGFALLPPELRNDRERCNEYLRQLLQKSSRLYLSIGLLGVEGEAKCIGMLPARNVQRAVASGGLSIGEYHQPGHMPPQGFTLSYPVVDAQRPDADVAFVVLNLAEMDELFAQLPVPATGFIAVVDRKGVVLARNPASADIIGRKLDATEIPENLPVPGKGVFRSSSADGAPHLYAYESIAENGGGAPALRVLVGVPLNGVYATANSTLFRIIAGVLVMTALLLIFAWFGAERFFLRNVRTLLATAKRIRAGDLAARTGMQYGKEELSQLGKAFDEMAQTLQERQKRIDESLDTLHQQSITDALTRLHNRRYLYETLPRELVRARRNGTTLGVIVIDIDHFKRINDTYGHEAGDMVLRWVGSVLTKSMRGSDLVCRHGGEEFCVALPDATQEGARAKAEEIRRALEALELDYCGHPLKITASLGVAAFPVHGEDTDTLLRVADEALYNAKTGGRNTVAVYGQEAAPAKVRSVATVASVTGTSTARAANVVSGMNSAGTGQRTGGTPVRPVDANASPERPASIQVLNGSMVGREFPLVNAATTFGVPGVEVVVVARNPQGYFLTHVEGPKFPVVNGSTIESRARLLSDHDVIEVAGVKMVFFYK